jgi:hypothetical protein
LDLDLAYRDNNNQIEAFAATKKKVKKSYKKPSSTDFRSRGIGLPYGIDETSSEEDSDMDEFEAESEAEAETAELDPTTEEPVNVETDPSSNYPTLLTPTAPPSLIVEITMTHRLPCHKKTLMCLCLPPNPRMKPIQNQNSRLDIPQELLGK